MKKIILSIALLSSSICFSQLIERKKLATGKTLDFKIEQRIKDKLDTMTYFIYSFQNIKYKSIIDLGLILITQKEDLELFADKLIEMSQVEKGSTVTIQFKEICSFSLTEMMPDRIYLTVDGKYSVIGKQNALLIAEEIKKYSYLLN